MQIILRTTAILCLLAVAATAAAADFLVVVNESNKTTNLATKELAAIFMKKKVQWSDGTKIMPAVLPDSNPATAAFDKQALNKAANALHAYWQQEIFSGRNTPPVEKASDDEVVAYVQKNASAIGYIGANAAHAGVHVVTITE